jgi:hypothetical protein
MADLSAAYSSSEEDEDDFGDAHGEDLTRAVTRLVPGGVVPPQDCDQSDKCGGTWVRSEEDGLWHLVDDLSDEALCMVQMRLGGLEREPSPPPQPPPQQQQQQQQQQRKRSPPSPPPDSEPPTKRAREVPVCVVCRDEQVAIVMRNCGHACLCQDCRKAMVERVKVGGWIKCPVCR